MKQKQKTLAKQLVPTQHHITLSARRVTLEQRRNWDLYYLDTAKEIVERADTYSQMFNSLLSCPLTFCSCVTGDFSQITALLLEVLPYLQGWVSSEKRISGWRYFDTGKQVAGKTDSHFAKLKDRVVAA